MAVAVEGLRLAYGERVALRDVTFSVRSGSCFGLLGPNGAGKSTTMKVLCGLVQPDAGTVRLFGSSADAAKEGHGVRGRIGYVPQAVTLYEKLTARENLALFGGLYGLHGRSLETRMTEVLAQVGLADRARDKVSSFSGGMKRRLNIAAALLHDPELVIMDEPTVGIDPQSRHHIFSLVREMTARGVTVIYCTHYLEEAEALCDDIAILDHGSVIAGGPLTDVLHRFAEPQVYLELDGEAEPPSLPAPEGGAADGSESRDAQAQQPAPSGAGWQYPVNGREVLDIVEWLARACRERGLRVRRLETVRPTLESVFLKLTGTSLRDEA